MDFFDVLASRRSVREYAPREVEPDRLARVLEAANAAPSAGNLQAYQMYVVRDRARRLALARAAWSQTFIAEAPVAIVFCAVPARSAAKYRSRGESLYCVQDATIACAHAHLAAAALGLGSVWVGAFDEEAARRALGLPAGERPIAILPLGYPAEKPQPTSRRRLADIAREL